MEQVKFDLSKKGIPFKVLNGINGGPWHKRHGIGPFTLSNLEDYKAARIPLQRIHDSGIYSIYGGPFSYDVTKIFRNFDADENDPESYDFANTDEAIQISLEAGTQIYFRLGETIEHQFKKVSVKPPKDFLKWAKICEHIIMHYNEGWADGFHYDITFWEIWCEPDLAPDDSPHKPLWDGTQAEFFDFFEITSRYLKNRFPDLKIGGPSLCVKQRWAEEFLAEMGRRKVPMDFFSWHIYTFTPERVLRTARIMREFLDKNGYADIPSYLTEYNYLNIDWSNVDTSRNQMIYTFRQIIREKSAAFTMATICEAQKNSTIDMLMYYCALPNAYCGVFDRLTYEPLKGYYPLAWYGQFYDLECDVACTESPENIYTLCGVDKDGKAMAIVTYYSNDDDAPDKDIAVDFGKSGKYEIYRVDASCTGELVDTTSDLNFHMPVHTILLIKEIA